MEQQVYHVTSVNNSGIMTAEEFHSCYPDITLRQMGTASESNSQVKQYRLINTDSGGDSNNVIYDAQPVSIPTTIPVVYQQQHVPQQITIENVDPNGSVLVPRQQVVYTSPISNGQVVIQPDNHSSPALQTVLLESPIQRNNPSPAVQLTPVNSGDSDEQQQQAHVIHYKGTTWTQIPGNQMKPRFEQTVVKNSPNVAQKVVSQRCAVYSSVRRLRPVKKCEPAFPSTMGQICPVYPTLRQQLLPSKPLSERVNKFEVSIETKTEDGILIPKRPSPIPTRPSGAVQNKQPTQQRTQLFIILPDGEKPITSFDTSLHNLNVRDVIQHMNLPDTVKVVVNPEGSFCREEVPDRENDDATDHGISKEEDEAPIYHEGLLAVCKPCGYSSLNFNRCDRCKRKLPSKCKTVPVRPIQLEKIVSRKSKCDNSLGPERKRSKGCKRKKPEEPVCLTISDDEDIERSTSQGSPPKLPCHHAEMLPSDPHVTVSAMGKEPVITEEMETEYQDKGEDEEYDLDDLLNDSSEEFTLLQCRTVRIGSYKVVPRDQVIISHHGIKISVPAIDNSESVVEVKILFHEIVKVLIHFGRGMPVLFFYTTPSAAAKIRGILKMTSTDGFYYDPRATTEETHKRITLLPERIQDDDKINLKSIFSGVNYQGEALLEELNSKEANDILVRASPKEVQNLIKKSVAGCQPYNGHPIRMIMVYPPPPAKGGIPINTEDYACLGEDQFLNDVIIDFYLKYVMQNLLSEEDQARTHVFSSFFYKRLTTRPSKASRRSLNPIEDDPTVSAAVKRHSRVKSWTKNVNIFTKDFIIIPVNEHCHWFLAIICFPGLSGPVRMSDNAPITIPTKKRKQILETTLPNEIGPTVLTGKRTLMIGSTTITALVPSAPSSINIEGEDEDRDEADGDEEDMDTTSSSEDESTVTNKAVSDPVQENNEIPQNKEEINDSVKGKQKEPIKQPCILIFDSLAGASRSKVAATLRDYLRIEYQAKNSGEEKDFSRDTMKSACPKVPQQTNYTDCGLYLLQYVETFFQKPIRDYRIPIKELQTWFTAETVSRKRYEIQQLLHRLMEEHNINIAELNLPVLDFSCSEEKRLVDYSGTEDEEEEECEDEDIEDEGECPEDEELGELEERDMGEEEEEDGEEDMEGEEEEEEEEEEPEEDMEEGLLDFPPFLIAPCKRKESVSTHLKSIRIPRLVKDSSPEITNVSKKLRSDD